MPFLYFQIDIFHVFHLQVRRISFWSSHLLLEASSQAVVTVDGDVRHVWSPAETLVVEQMVGGFLKQNFTDD